MKKEIWIPTTETKVRINPSGEVIIWDEIAMELKPLKKETGFTDGYNTKDKDIS